MDTHIQLRIHKYEGSTAHETAGRWKRGIMVFVAFNMDDQLAVNTVQGS